jgi:ATP-dependent exoDNAse (exonuclease V) alpha subunit
VENGTRGQITHVDERGVTITLDGSGRRIQLASEHLDSLRLAYAQHVYRQQGATVERSIVLTGGWQASKETAYVEATRARHGTDWYIARDQLGNNGQDADRIKRLAQNMSHSRRQTPSLDYREATDLGWQPSRNPLRLHHILRPAHWLTRQSARDAPDRSARRGR